MTITCGKASNRHPWLQLFLLGLALPLALFGCGSDRVSVSGKVVVNGSEPVKGGTIVFSPVAKGGGTPATVEVGQDGTFSTTAPAVRCSVFYTPATMTAPGPSAPSLPNPYQGMSPKEAEVDLKSGSNLTIELVKK